MRIAARAVLLTAHFFLVSAFAQGSLALSAIEPHLVGSLKARTIDEVRRVRSANSASSATEVRLQGEVPALTAAPSNLQPRVNRIVTTPWVVFAYDVNTGLVEPNVNMVLSPLRHQANSGGHVHDSSARPKGSLSAFGGNTGPSGMELVIRYTSPEVSGVVYSDGACSAPNGFRCFDGYFYSFTTKVQGLQDLGPNAAYVLVGDKPWHPSNHWGTSSFVAKLRHAAALYNMKYGSKLEINDLSLEWGGLFDINQDWSHPHREHRIGVSADVRLVPPGRRDDFALILQQAGIVGPILREPSHWHIREFSTRE